MLGSIYAGRDSTVATMVSMDIIIIRGHIRIDHFNGNSWVVQLGDEIPRDGG
jgi:hypothetical protein